MGKRKDRAGHYIKDMVYGANDGIITTFAVVAGVTGGGLSPEIILIIGLASLFADGFSMAASDYLGSRSEEAVQQSAGLKPLWARSAFTGALLTFVAFVVAGAVPLLPYLFSEQRDSLFTFAAIATGIALAVVGALRSLVTRKPVLTSTFEMLAVGGVAAFLAYTVGYQIQAFVQG